MEAGTGLHLFVYLLLFHLFLSFVEFVFFFSFLVINHNNLIIIIEFEYFLHKSFIYVSHVFHMMSFSSTPPLHFLHRFLFFISLALSLLSNPVCFSSPHSHHPPFLLHYPSSSSLSPSQLSLVLLLFQMRAAVFC